MYGPVRAGWIDTEKPGVVKVRMIKLKIDVRKDSIFKNRVNCSRTSIYIRAFEPFDSSKCFEMFSTCV